MGRVLCGALRPSDRPASRRSMAGRAERRLDPVAGRSRCGPQDRVHARGPRSHLRGSDPRDVPRVVPPTDDDGHSLLADRPPVCRGGLRGVRWVRALGHCIADSRGCLGALLPRSRGPLPDAASRRGREGLLTTPGFVCGIPFRGDGVARVSIAGGHGGSYSPMGDGLGPRAHAVADVGPVARSCVRRQGPAWNPAARFRTRDGGGIECLVAMNLRRFELRLPKVTNHSGFAPFAGSDRSRRCSWNLASSDRISLRRSLCRRVRAMEMAGGSNATARTTAIVKLVKSTWAHARAISRTITMDGGRKNAVNTPSIRTRG